MFFFVKNFNKTNDELQNMINIQNDINFVSRNKKQNTSKITITQSHNEINMKDIQIKSVKNLKSSNKFIKWKISNHFAKDLFYEIIVAF